MSSSFAFVEYESRRDADDAYHEMHNKRLGRDDVLKIEVGTLEFPSMAHTTNTAPVGTYTSFRILALRFWPRPRTSPQPP